MSGERQESLGHYEMLWDCEFCEARGLLAKSQRHCALCGGAQNADKRYFPKEGEAKRVDGHTFEGSDRHCPACNTPQSAAATNCTQCGAPLDGSKQVRGIAAVAPVAPRKRKPVWMIVAIVLGLVFLIWFRCVRTKEAQLTITGHRWVTAIPVEQYAAVEESDWRDRLPSGARATSCTRKQRSTRQVPTGEEDCQVTKRDNKDGTFEQVKTCKPMFRDEPVDGDWCRYTVEKWQTVTTLEQRGEGTAVTWPTGDLPPAQAPATLGARRQGTRVQTLTLLVGTQACEVTEAVWKKYSDGQKAKVEVRASSGQVVCSSL